MSSGIESMMPDGTWIPYEEYHFGPDWKPLVQQHLDELNERKANYDSSYKTNLAINDWLKDGLSEEMAHYLGHALGLSQGWWELMIPTKLKDRIAFATTNGYVKAVDTANFSKINKNGKIAIELREHDSLVGTYNSAQIGFDGMTVAETRKEFDKIISLGLTDKHDKQKFDRWYEDEVQDFFFLVTTNGIAVKFPLDDLSSKGRSSRGVSGIRLKTNDIVISADVVNNEDLILIVTENGIGKLVEVSDFRKMKRGAVGVKGLETTRKTGRVIAAITILDKYDGVMLLTNKGQMIKLKTATIPIYKRQAQGVRLMNLREGDKIVSGTRIADV